MERCSVCLHAVHDAQHMATPFVLVTFHICWICHFSFTAGSVERCSVCLHAVHDAQHLTTPCVIVTFHICWIYHFSFTAGSVERCSACAALPTTHRCQGTTPASWSPSANPATRCCATLLPWSFLSVDAVSTWTTKNRAKDGFCVAKGQLLESVDDLDIIDLHTVC